MIGVTPTARLAKRTAKWQRVYSEAEQGSADQIMAEIMVARLESQKDAIVHYNPRFWMVVLRGLIIAPFIAYIWQVIVYAGMATGTAPVELPTFLQHLGLIAAVYYFGSLSGVGVKEALRVWRSRA